VTSRRSSWGVLVQSHRLYHHQEGERVLAHCRHLLRFDEHNRGAGLQHGELADHARGVLTPHHHHLGDVDIVPHRVDDFICEFGAPDNAEHHVVGHSLPMTCRLTFPGRPQLAGDVLGPLKCCRPPLGEPIAPSSAVPVDVTGVEQLTKVEL
jgi:hypothetical protein